MAVDYYQLQVTRQDICNGVRPTSADEELVNRCIEEAQNLDIIPTFGADWWLRVLDREHDAVAQLLWDGGLYTDNDGNARLFAGLKKCLLYYSYARLVRSQGGTSTRYDFVVKADQYSDSADLKAKMQAYNEAFATADGYKAQCLLFINEGSPCNASRHKLTNNRLSIKKIGK